MSFHRTWLSTALAIALAILWPRSYSSPTEGEVFKGYYVGSSIVSGEVRLFVNVGWYFRATTYGPPHDRGDLVGADLPILFRLGGQIMPDFPPTFRMPLLATTWNATWSEGAIAPDWQYHYADVRLPAWLVLIGLCLLPARAALYAYRNRRRDKSTIPCAACGYDLRGQATGALTIHCPECGKGVMIVPVPPIHPLQQALMVAARIGLSLNFLFLLLAAYMAFNSYYRSTYLESNHWNITAAHGRFVLWVEPRYANQRTDSFSGEAESSPWNLQLFSLDFDPADELSGSYGSLFAETSERLKSREFSAPWWLLLGLLSTPLTLSIVLPILKTRKRPSSVPALTSTIASTREATLSQSKS
jgi:hypothetical protein